jgi:membrane protein DedA with SNARE-associated domain
VPPEERARADHILRRWGGLAIVVTRPVPLLAETVAIMAGTSPLGWRRAALAALLGSLPPALLYALSGATAAALTSGILVLGLVLLVAGIFWLVGYLAEVYLVDKRERSS